MGKVATGAREGHFLLPRSFLLQPAYKEFAGQERQSNLVDEQLVVFLCCCNTGEGQAVSRKQIGGAWPRVAS